MSLRALGMLAFVLCLASGNCVLAQDTLPRPKAAFRIIFNFDFRNTFIDGDPIKFYGFRLGAQRDRDVIAIGFYGIGDRFVQKDVLLPGIGTRELHTDFDYTAFTYERILIDTKRWQVGIPLSVGLGNYRRAYMNDENKLVPYSTNELVPLEASVHADYNLFWWVFIGVGGGYRHVLAGESEATRSLSDWTYYMKVGFRVGEVVKRVSKSVSSDG